MRNVFLPFFLGLRYTMVKQRSHMVSFISRVSMAGLTLGVALLIVVLSVMNGFDRELRNNILGLVPQASINSYQPMENWQEIADQALLHKGVKAAAPFIHLQGLLMNRGDVETVLVHGVLPAAEQQVSVLDRFLIDGDILDLEPGSLIIGVDLARILAVEVGSRITFIMPQASAGNSIVPQIRQFKISDILDSGTELDRRLALIHIDDARRLGGYGEGVQGVRLSVNELFRSTTIAAEVVYALPYGYFARDWSRSHGNLFEAIQLSKRLVGLLLFIIIAVAAFNVVSTLILVVMDKRSDIAILRTMGLSPAAVMGIFMVQGTLIGLIGTTAGAVIGVGLALGVSDLVQGLESLFSVQFLQSDVYPVNHLPSYVDQLDLLLVCGVAIGMSFIATLYPAWRATRIPPAEALRHEG
jgi:lipoprotein-releasing system permease protein